MLRRIPLLPLALIALLGLSFTLAGCEEGPAEQAGETLDNAAENAADAVEDAADKVEDSTN